MFEAAADRDFFTSGVDIDERPKDPEHIIMSMVKRSDQAVQQAVCDVAKGSFKGGAADARHQGERGRARVPGRCPKDELKEPSKLPAEVQDKLKELKEQVGSGKITVKQ